MRLPLSWIKEHVELDKSPFEIAEILTSLGLEVDSIEEEALPFESVVVARIEKVYKHPNAGKLVVTEINDGEGVHQVVCGDSSCREGMKVAYARVGAKLKDFKKNEFFEMKATKIRGVESFGMLCALDELGIEDGPQGIVELPFQAKLGESAASYFGDKIFDISLTPNLGHALSVSGVARELAAATGAPWVEVPVVFKEAAEKVEKEVEVQVEDVHDCPAYSIRVFKGVVVGQSPLWLRRRLEACGLRSVNNVVDITNYVMLELGQPLHAFDLVKAEAKRVIVRRAREGEKLVLLDGKERDLNPSILVVANDRKPLAVAGIMGGEDSSVTSVTRDVLLEAALFHPGVIRKGCKELSISSDSSRRFERGIDPLKIERALNRAAMLIQEICGVPALEGVVKAGDFNPKLRVIRCRLSRIGQILGMHLGLDEVETVFKRLKFVYKWDGKSEFIIEAPSYRNDLSTEVDIIEEVARIIGYQNVPRKIPYFTSSTIGHAPIFLFEQEVKKNLIAQGLQEFITCDLISALQAGTLVGASEDLSSFISVLNPTSVEQSILRPSLIPGLLQVVKRNYDFQIHDIRGFEVGKIHFRVDDHFKEQSMAACIMAGRLAPHSWDVPGRGVDFFDLKGILECFLKALRIETLIFEKSDHPLYHPGRQAKMVSSGLEVGTLGEIHPELQRKLDISERIYAAEINLHDLFGIHKKQIKMEPLPLYPASSRDWTVTVREDISASQILQAIHSIYSPFLESVELKYIYRSEKLGETKKNVTFHFVYRDKNGTIENKTVDLEHAQVVEKASLALKHSK